MVAVIDYGLGNLRSVSKALEAVGAEVEVTNNSEKIAKAKAIVLPGVGAFYKGMKNLIRLGILPTIFEAIEEGKPFLGICLGFQLLFSESEEYGACTGFNIIEGEVRRFGGNMKIPHMGWNQVEIKKPATAEWRGAAEGGKTRAQKPDLFKDIPDKSYFYFVHSYYVVPNDESVVIGITEYGLEFTCAINKGNIWGVQFHPEKSADSGLMVLKNFISLY